MGQQQSKEELLYQQVSYGNTEGIKALCREGAGLEWVDKEGKTPLIVACMNPELHNVARTLIELGANVNAYRPGGHNGTPLHHASKRGLENNVKLLLSHGANSLIMNDDCQSPLDMARAKGHTNVVRTIESHVCLFSGWLREFYGPGFLEVLAPQLVTRKVWAVILPSGARNLTKPFKLELAIYTSLQDAQPRVVVPLWKANLDETKLQQSDPSVMIGDNKTRLKLASGNENDKQQLQRFCNACKGIPSMIHPSFMHSNQGATISATAPPAPVTEDVELTMAIDASIQSAMQGRPHFPDPNPNPSSEGSTSSGWNPVISSSPSGPVAPAPHSMKTGTSESEMHETGQSSNSNEHAKIQTDSIPPAQMSDVPDSIPSAPLAADEILNDSAIHYPSIDSSPIDLSSPTAAQDLLSRTGELKEHASSPSCVICLDAPIEGACIPCGHMAGCMSCLNEIKSKKWGCPVCRAKIDQVVRLYAV